MSDALEADPSLSAADADDDDERKKRRRRMFKFIAAKVLRYHGLPEALTAKEIAQNVTLATALKAEDGSYGGMYRRLRVERQFIPPGETHVCKLQTPC